MAKLKALAAEVELDAEIEAENKVCVHVNVYRIVHKILLLWGGKGKRKRIKPLKEKALGTC